jgi:hypothetical protein
MAKIAVGSAVEAYFDKLGAMLLRYRSENGITRSALFRRALPTTVHDAIDALLD